MPDSEDPPCGLLVDWGGVMTTNVFASFEAFCLREGLPGDRVTQVLRADPLAHEALVALETGALDEDVFEARFASMLGVPTDRLIERLMTDVRPDIAMIAAVRRARDHGLVTGLISNSWGVGRYDADELRDLFDGVVISGNVGVRKPAPEIYLMGTRAVHLPPTECVYVDDLPGNLKPAWVLGMRTVHHRDAATTIAALSEHFGVDLT